MIGHKGCTGWNYPSIVKCLWLFTRFCLDEISSQDVLIPVKKTGMKFHSGMKRKKKSCFENFCSLKKKGPYPSFLSEQKFSKQYFQKTAFVIISLKFWNNEIPGKISLRWICLVYIYETVNLRGKIEKNGNLFFPFENQFLWFKTKSTFSALYLYLEN